uniref:Uncharacterized protein n=1 Tax=Strigamia maritima TaxID=126957 RepID=T1JN99_STRMM
MTNSELTTKHGAMKCSNFKFQFTFPNTCNVTLLDNVDWVRLLSSSEERNGRIAVKPDVKPADFIW